MNAVKTIEPTAPHAPTSAAWPRVVLKGAAIYNVAWGASVMAFPDALFTLAGMTAPAYPWLFQCIGMIVAVYGVGYWIAAGDPRRYWPVVLVGLLGKVSGPIGFLRVAVAGDIDWRFGVTILTNDLLWWPLFALILLEVYRQSRLDAHEPAAGSDRPDTALKRFHTQHGISVMDLSHRSTVLVVFLRHAGCTFCREALAGIRTRRERIEAAGTRIVLVHMMEENSETKREFERFGLGDVDRVSDPERRLYRAFELGQGSLRQLMGVRVWWRGVVALLKGHGVGALAGDGLQMPGTFAVENGEIVDAFRHRTVADRPDYVAMACGLARGT